MKLRSNLLRAALVAAALATSTPNYATTSTTNYTDPAGVGTSVYMVRAVKLEVSGSGS